MIYASILYLLSTHFRWVKDTKLNWIDEPSRFASSFEIWTNRKSERLLNSHCRWWTKSYSAWNGGKVAINLGNLWHELILRILSINGSQFCCLCGTQSRVKRLKHHHVILKLNSSRSWVFLKFINIFYTSKNSPETQTMGIFPFMIQELKAKFSKMTRFQKVTNLPLLFPETNVFLVPGFAISPCHGYGYQWITFIPPQGMAMVAWPLNNFWGFSNPNSQKGAKFGGKCLAVFLGGYQCVYQIYVYIYIYTQRNALNMHDFALFHIFVCWNCHGSSVATNLIT